MAKTPVRRGWVRRVIQGALMRKRPTRVTWIVRSDGSIGIKEEDAEEVDVSGWGWRPLPGPSPGSPIEER